jgi:hypothetical protein
MNIRKCWRVSAQEKTPTATKANTETPMRSVRHPKHLCLRLQTSAITDVRTVQTPTARSGIRNKEMPLNKKPTEQATIESPEATTSAKPAEANTAATIRTGGR